MQQYISAPAQDGDPHQQPTMSPDSATAMAPFNLLGLPQELRDEIYELAIFDHSPLPMFNTRSRADTSAYRNMNTNILLTSRKMYWEARGVIVRRGRMVMVSAIHLYPRMMTRSPAPMEILTTWSKIAVIHPKYRNLCIMNHHINGARLSSIAELGDERKWEFIIHQREIKNFCHVLMGKLAIRGESLLGSRSTHTLFLHCPPSYAQHEYMSVDAMQIRVLKEYRSILRGFEDIAICGTSTGWESGLYSATLKDIRATDARKGPIEFIDGIMNDLRDFEKEGFDTLLQTGDLEAADASWYRALVVCRNARMSFASSTRSPPTHYDRTRHASNTQMWAKLIRTHGNTCAVPIIEFWYRLLSIRLSEVLRLIQRGGHLATRHGRAPIHPQLWGDCVLQIWDQSKEVGQNFHIPDWLPEPSEEAQMCCTVAAIFRLLDDPHKMHMAGKAMDRAIELLPDEETIKQERCRVDDWMALAALNDPSPDVRYFSMVV